MLKFNSYLCNGVTLLTLMAFMSCAAPSTPVETTPKRTNWNNEVIYHVMPRSFYDSNGDSHGDLAGMTQKLDYLQDLGITAVLFTPLYESQFYHNYFPTDYYAIDPEYGSMDDYIEFVRAVHKRGMKFIMDMETQYVQDGHPWFDTSYRNPGSEYEDFVYYQDSLNTIPAQLFLEMGTPLWDYLAWPNDTSYNIATLDLNNKTVHQWQKEFYTFWVDPNRDGDLSDGVDGFRIDHIMDDLDDKGIFTDLYSDFWTPIFDTCRTINPNLFIVGEQANWGEYGDEIVNRTSADAAFNFPLKFTIRNTHDSGAMAADKTRDTAWSVNAERLHTVIQNCLEKFGKDHYYINFIENHDTDRFASLVNGDARKLRIGAVLLATLPGTPSIYYGQELGLPGKIGDWGSDANHIPIREAFPWEPDVDATGIAAFYRDSGPWWMNSFYHSENLNDYALATQRIDQGSLWRHYQAMLSMRKDRESLRTGNYTPVDMPAYENLIVFFRTSAEESTCVFVNAGPTAATIAEGSLRRIGSGMEILSENGVAFDGRSLAMAPYSYAVFSMNPN